MKEGGEEGTELPKLPADDNPAALEGYIKEALNNGGKGMEENSKKDGESALEIEVEELVNNSFIDAPEPKGLYSALKSIIKERFGGKKMEANDKKGNGNYDKIKKVYQTLKGKLPSREKIWGSIKANRKYLAYFSIPVVMLIGFGVYTHYTNKTPVQTEPKQKQEEKFVYKGGLEKTVDTYDADTEDVKKEKTVLSTGLKEEQELIKPYTKRVDGVYAKAESLGKEFSAEEGKEKGALIKQGEEIKSNRDSLLQRIKDTGDFITQHLFKRIYIIRQEIEKEREDYRTELDGFKTAYEQEKAKYPLKSVKEGQLTDTKGKSPKK